MCASPNESTDILAVLETEFAELETESNCSLEQSVCEGPSVTSPALETTFSDAEAQSTPLFVSTLCEQAGGEDILCEPTAFDAQVKTEVEQFLSNTCKCSLGLKVNHVVCHSHYKQSTDQGTNVLNCLTTNWILSSWLRFIL